MKTMLESERPPKGGKILLLDADGDCAPLLKEASVEFDAEVILARTIRAAVAFLSLRMPELGCVVIDVDPGAHGLALLEAISACAEHPPMVVLTALEETYMRPIAFEHGATACLGKPITRCELRAALREVSKRSLTCDRWGSPVPAKCCNREDVCSSFRGIAEKLSPITSSRAR
jgi:DNA-binding response OmpR family regulator